MVFRAVVAISIAGFAAKPSGGKAVSTSPTSSPSLPATIAESVRRRSRAAVGGVDLLRVENESLRRNNCRFHDRAVPTARRASVN